eukprot:Gb_01827 [translate_table: standard]
MSAFQDYAASSIDASVMSVRYPEGAKAEATENSSHEAYKERVYSSRSLLTEDHLSKAVFKGRPVLQRFYSEIVIRSYEIGNQLYLKWDIGVGPSRDYIAEYPPGIQIKILRACKSIN